MYGTKVRFFISGTDTGVGKTVLSLLMMRYFYHIGANPFYFKPFQTGCASPSDPESDANFIYSHLPQLKGKDPSFSVGYCLKEPKAPYFAARNENKKISLSLVKKILREREKDHNPVIIEGSGGLYVPLTRKRLIISVIKSFDSIPILVARAGLGTINHTLLSLEALRRKKIKPLCVILVDKDNTPKEMIKENIEAIQSWSGIPVAGVVNKLEDFSCVPSELFDIFRKMFKNMLEG
jgi:dethiobiotin synthetase